VVHSECCFVLGSVGDVGCQVWLGCWTVGSRSAAVLAWPGLTAGSGLLGEVAEEVDGGQELGGPGPVSGNVEVTSPGGSGEPARAG